MKIRQSFRIAIVLLPCLSCSDFMGPRAPVFHLAAVDGKPLPSPLYITSDFDRGTVYTFVAGAQITLRDDGTFGQSVVIAEYGKTEGWLPRHTVHASGTYVIAKDSITICWGCGSGGSSMSWVMPYSRAGFTMPMLFSTGRFGAYRYVWP